MSLLATMDREDRHTMPPASQRPKPAELRDGSAPRGLECPHCGARHIANANHGVDKTIPEGMYQSIDRVRVCRNCGGRFTTVETVFAPCFRRKPPA